MNGYLSGLFVLAVSMGLITGCDDGSTRALTTGPIEVDAGLPDAGAAKPDIPLMDAVVRAAVTKVIFVSNDGDALGNGSRFEPYPDVQTAYSHSLPGDIVQLLPGYYRDVHGPPDSVVLQGSGTGVTVIVGPMTLSGVASELRELSIEGGTPALTVLSQSKMDTITIRNGVGALDIQAQLEARDLIVEDVESEPDAVYGFEGTTPSDGAAIKVGPDGVFLWDGGRLINAPWTGLRTRGNTTLHGVDFIKTGGLGLVIDDGLAQLHSVTIRRASLSGILVTGGEIRLELVRIHEVRPSPTAPLRSGLLAYGGRVIMTETEVMGVDRGIRLSRGTHLTISNVRIIDPQIDGVSLDNAVIDGSGLEVTSAGNTGVSVVNEGRLNLSSLHIRNTGRLGILVDQSTFELVDVEIVGSAERGAGLLRSQGILRNVHISDAQNVGIQITDASGEVRIEGGTIRDSRTSGIAVTGLMHEAVILDLILTSITLGEAELGEGIHLYQARAYLQGVHSERHAGAGVLAESSLLRTDGLTVHANGGPGIVLVDSLEGTLLNGLTATDNVGVGALILQGEAQIADFVVERTVNNLSIGPGDGIVASFGSRISLENGRSDANQGSGISIQGATVVILAGVSAADNGGWGLHSSCGQTTVDIQSEPTFENNGSGGQIICP